MPSRGAGHRASCKPVLAGGKRRAGVVLGVVETKTLLKANRLLVGKDWLLSFVTYLSAQMFVGTYGEKNGSNAGRDGGTDRWPGFF
jgi:hypothetical protein